MSTHPEPDPPEGLESRVPTTPPPSSANRPDWLVGAGDVLEGDKDAETPTRRTLADMPAARSPMRVVPGGKPEPSGVNPEPPKGWSGAASSVPKLSIIPSRERPPDLEPEQEEFSGQGPGHELAVEGRASDGEKAAREEPAFRPLDEPWHLVWLEVLLTNRKLQGALIAVLIVIAAVIYWPKPGASGASLGTILRHPERFQGRSVSVRGEVLETFEVGLGHAFQLRQGRDVVVVYSTLREPRPHDHLNVVGTVSTGYLDGQPRVAIFEGAAP